MKKILAVCLTAIVMMFAASCNNKPQEEVLQFDFNNVIDLIRESEKDLNYIEYMVEENGSRTFYDIVVTDDSIWHDLNEYIEIFCYDETDPTYFNEGFVINVKDSTYYLNRR